MLAQIGRGFSDVVVYKERIYSQMLQLINMAAVPVITNVTLSIEGVKGVELCTFLCSVCLMLFLFWFGYGVYCGVEKVLL